MDADLHDLTVFKLRKMQEKEREAGNLVAEHSLEILIEGYNEGIWSVYWDNGEPLFAMTDELPEDVLKTIREKE